MSEEEIVAVCSDCKTMIPDRVIERNPFYKSGGRIDCKFCGGLVIITTRGGVDQALKQADRQRGL